MLNRFCGSDAEKFHKLPQIMEGKGYAQNVFEKLVGKLVEDIRPALDKEDKKVSVWILMLLSVVVRSEKKKELLNCPGLNSWGKES